MSVMVLDVLGPRRTAHTGRGQLLLVDIEDDEVGEVDGVDIGLFAIADGMTLIDGLQRANIDAHRAIRRRRRERDGESPANP